MADFANSISPARRQPNRLQKRAPASLQISPTPVTEWNVAIPLLSPLIQSPASDNPTVEIRSCSGRNTESAAAAVAEKKPVAVMKKWQHPAAPFSYEPAPFMPCIYTGVSGR